MTVVYAVHWRRRYVSTVHLNSKGACRLVFLPLLKDLLVAGLTSEVGMPLEDVAVPEGTLGFGVALHGIFGELL